MSQQGIVIRKNLEDISDCFNVLKYMSFNDWKISAKEGQVAWWGEYEESIRKEEEKRKQEKTKAQKEKILANFKNACYHDAIAQIDEFFTLYVPDEDIIKLQGNINEIFSIKEKIEKARNGKKFKTIQEELALLLDLNENDEEAGSEKQFLDDALSFLDGSELATIDSIERCRDSIDRISKLIRHAPNFYLDDLTGINSQLLSQQKELERKEMVTKLNEKLKQAFTDENYDGVLVLFEEAQQHLRSDGELIVASEQCKECAKTGDAFKNAIDKQDFAGAFNLLETLCKINPYPNGVNLRIGYFERYFSLCREIANEKNPVRLLELIREKEKNPGEFPQYLQPGFDKVINEAKERIEKEKLRLKAQGEEKRERKQFAEAAGLLKKAALLESDEEARTRIALEIKKIKSEKIDTERFKRRRYVYAGAIGIVILIMIGFGRVIENNNTKKKIFGLLREVRPLIEKGKFDEVKVKLTRVFSESKELNEAQNIDQNIQILLEMLFSKLMWAPPEESTNNQEDMSNRVEQVKRVLKGLPAPMSEEWLRKADEILNLSREFGKRMDERQSGKALDALVKLKRTRGEKSIPFDILLEVSYLNGSHCPEIDLKGIKFVFVKGGEFEHGCFNQADSTYSTNAPLVTKALNSFWISKEEITISQYNKEAAAAREQPGFPRNAIDWAGASSFARNFGKEYALMSDLPTEAQWKYMVVRGGSFADDSTQLKIYLRHANSEYSRDVYTGFRIVLECDKQ